MIDNICRHQILLLYVNQSRLNSLKREKKRKVNQKIRFFHRDGQRRLSTPFINAVYQRRLSTPLIIAVSQRRLSMPFINAVYQRRLTKHR